MAPGSVGTVIDRLEPSFSPGSRRSDIQGLRALAVLLVVVYHAGIPLRGGFVGVDVFFVISGYFMTRILTADLDGLGRVRFRRFYRRRVRRLLPALVLVTVVTVIVATFLQSPLHDLTVTSESGLATSAFLGNFAAYHFAVSYFGTPGLVDPFLQMWSLGVEEQFYLFLPAFLLIAAFLGRRCNRKVEESLIVALIGVAAVSFACSYAVSEGLGPFSRLASSLAFFMFPFRAWEFAIGGLAGILPTFYVRGLSRTGAEVVAAFGLGGIVGCSFLVTGTTPFPGMAAVLPVVGAAAVLYAGRIGRTQVSRVLSLPPLRSLGDVSYSWYLWHWPAIVFVRYFTSSTWWLCAAAIGSLGLAYLTYNLVENPFRFDRVAVARSAPLLLAGGIALSAIFCGLVLGGNREHWGNPSLAALESSSSPALGARDECTVIGTVTVSEFPRCTWVVPHAKRWIEIVGDSHAGALTDGIISAAKPLAYTVTSVTGASCGFTSAAPSETSNVRNCGELYHWDIERAIQRNDKASLVVISNFGSARAKDLGGTGAWIAALKRSIDTVRAADVPVLVVEDVPEVSVIPTSCRFGAILPLSCEESVKRNNRIEGSVRNAEIALVRSYRSGVYLINPTATFCNKTECMGREGDTMLYTDNQHLDRAGSLKLSTQFRAVIEELNSHT